MHASIRPTQAFRVRMAAAVVFSILSSTALAGWSFLTLSGVPSTSVVAGQPYAFQPTATSRYSRSLTFSISNKPAWASFDRVTGRLWGTSTDAGVWSNIVIGVTDGRKTARLPAFRITVTAVTTPVASTSALTPTSTSTAIVQPVTGNATISWLPPTQNTDGSTLTNLSGYKVFYGTDPTSLSQSVQIPNPGLTICVIESLSQGTWYFAVKAFSANGTESDASNVASKTI